MSTFLKTVVLVMCLGCAGGREVADSRSAALVQDGGRPPCPSDASTCVPVQLLSVDGGCSDARWVGELEGTYAQCGAPPGLYGQWTGAPLFPSHPEVAVPPALRPFCLYQWASPGGAPPDLNALATLDARLSRRHRDCAAVSATGKSALDEAWRELRTNFQSQAGMTAIAGTPARVRVAVVDTAPDARSVNGTSGDTSGHGHAIASLIRELTCAGGNCLELTSHLALPRLSLQKVDLLHGGYFGFQSELALAIYLAHRDWRLTRPESRLVLNLSLGWAPEYGGLSPDPVLPAPVRAVLRSIQHASCWDALVVAAAGNDPGGPTPSVGPLFPARWETRPRPSAADCNALEGPGYGAGFPMPLPPPATAAYSPLVYAVAAVQANDELVTNARPGGIPRLVAPGSHAVAMGVDGGPTRMLTGSSVSAAVVSAVAASAWSYRPTLSAAQLMAELQTASAALGTVADFCLGSSCTLSTSEVRRVDHCATMKRLCAPDAGVLCPAAPVACAARLPYQGILPAPTQAQRQRIEAAATDRADAGGVGYALPALAVCGQRPLLSAVPEYRATSCPGRQYQAPSQRPWSGPQPPGDPCPLCYGVFTESYGQLILDIDRKFEGALLEVPVLTLNGEYTLPLPTVDGLSAGDRLVVDKFELGGIEVQTASIAFMVELQGEVFSVTSELMLVR